MAQVLVVDDQPEVRTTMRRILELAGHQVQEAETARSALDTCRATPPDIAVVDILMPDMDGLEFIIALRRCKNATRVLAISGGGSHGDVDFLAEAEGLGAHATLQKPFGATELRQAVSALTAGTT